MSLEMPLDMIFLKLEGIKNKLTDNDTVYRKIPYDLTDCYLMYIKKKDKIYFAVLKDEVVDRHLEKHNKLFATIINEEEFTCIEVADNDRFRQLLSDVNEALKVS